MGQGCGGCHDNVSRLKKPWDLALCCILRKTAIEVWQGRVKAKFKAGLPLDGQLTLSLCKNDLVLSQGSA